jgi:hypothetical protein
MQQPSFVEDLVLRRPEGWREQVGKWLFRLQAVPAAYGWLLLLSLRGEGEWDESVRQSLADYLTVAVALWLVTRHLPGPRPKSESESEKVLFWALLYYLVPLGIIPLLLLKDPALLRPVVSLLSAHLLLVAITTLVKRAWRRAVSPQESAVGPSATLAAGSLRCDVCESPLMAVANPDMGIGGCEACALLFDLRREREQPAPRPGRPEEPAPPAVQLNSSAGLFEVRLGEQLLRVAGDGLEVVGPHRRRIARSAVKGIHCSPRGTGPGGRRAIAVTAALEHGEDVLLLEGFDSLPDARWLERQLSWRLDLPARQPVRYPERLRCASCLEPLQHAEPRTATSACAACGDCFSLAQRRRWEPLAHRLDWVRGLRPSVNITLVQRPAALVVSVRKPVFEWVARITLPAFFIGAMFKFHQMYTSGSIKVDVAITASWVCILLASVLACVALHSLLDSTEFFITESRFEWRRGPLSPQPGRWGVNWSDVKDFHVGRRNNLFVLAKDGGSFAILESASSSSVPKFMQQVLSRVLASRNE